TETANVVKVKRICFCPYYTPKWPHPEGWAFISLVVFSCPFFVMGCAEKVRILNISELATQFEGS
ncbi:hypothetical protein OFC62_39810, partial [Escherichia coli]|nr:hypothetical protein [Escherichia coli]